jgi:hypothetical protein
MEEEMHIPTAEAQGTEPALRRIGTKELVAALGGVSEGRIYDLGLEVGNASPQGSPEHMAGFRLSRCRSSTETRAAYGLEFAPSS